MEREQKGHYEYFGDIGEVWVGENIKVSVEQLEKIKGRLAKHVIEKFVNWLESPSRGKWEDTDKRSHLDFYTHDPIEDPVHSPDSRGHKGS